MQVQSFIQHPTEVPVKLVISDDKFPLTCINNSTSTGVYIHTPISYSQNSCVEVEINVQSPAFFAKGYVCSCEPLAGGIGFQIGVRFDCPETAFAVRMIEQICYIEQYRQQVNLTEGRVLSSDTAALEWISQHAANFPELKAYN